LSPLFVSFFSRLESTFNVLSFGTLNTSGVYFLTLLWPFFVLGIVACLHRVRTAASHPGTNSLLLFLFLLETEID
jgi:hypothetical protein